MLERFPAKWRPVHVKKTRQIKNLEPRSDSIGTETALVRESARKSKQSAGNRSVENRTLGGSERALLTFPPTGFL